MDKGKGKATELQPISLGVTLVADGCPASEGDDLAPSQLSHVQAPATPPRASPLSVTSRSSSFFDDEPVPSTSSTPPQLSRPAFVELVETCPTPPSAATTESSRYRRRPLLQANPSLVSLALVNEIGDDDTPAAVNALDERPHELPSAWQNDTHSRRRSRQSRRSTDSARTAAPLSELATAELVASILLQGPQVAAASTADAQPHLRRPSLDTRHSSRLSNDPYGVSSRYEGSRKSPSLDLRQQSFSSSHSLRPLSTPQHRPSAPALLRTRPSTVTLVSWDVSHLPAPNTPRERPFKVPFRSVFLPTSYLGGGKGTGLYGDPCGPIERKVKRERARPSNASGGSVGLGERWRRWSGRRSSAMGYGGRTSWDEASSIPPSATEDVGSLARETERPPSRSSSLLRGFRRRSWLSTPSSSEVNGAPEQPHARRESLTSVLFGSRRSKAASKASSEGLEAWVSVVVR